MSPNPQETADLVMFTEEILNGKLHFFCSQGHSKGRKDTRNSQDLQGMRQIIMPM